MGLLPTQHSPGIRYCAHGGSKDKGSRRSHESTAVRVADLVVQTETPEPFLSSLFSCHMGIRPFLIAQRRHPKTAGTGPSALTIVFSGNTTEAMAEWHFNCVLF